MHKNTKVFVIPPKRYIIGKQIKITLPVNLLAYVCKKATVLYLIKPTISDTDLILHIAISQYII